MADPTINTDEQITLQDCLCAELIKHGMYEIAAYHESRKAMKTADGQLQARAMLLSAGYDALRLRDA